jgi:hypothetical protein
MMRFAGSMIVLVAASAGIIVMTHPWSSQAGHDSFAADRDNGFDAERAMGYLKDLCKIGTRISGSDGMKKQQEMLKKHFEARGGKVEFQRFTARQRSQPDPVAMANLIVSWRPERQKRVILCSHYDTRPIADEERDRRKWHEPFLSANDGGSGVALLMELANHMKDLDTQVGLDFVLFDGEEYIFDPRRDGDRYFFGSEHFADAYKKGRPKHRYIAAVLLDMIAGKKLHLPVEANSWDSASWLVRDLWKIASEQKSTAFDNRLGGRVLDDHLALNAARIPTVDMIDFEYPHWHKLTDLPENCSADSMAQVARVLITWLERVK